MLIAWSFCELWIIFESLNEQKSMFRRCLARITTNKRNYFNQCIASLYVFKCILYGWHITNRHLKEIFRNFFTFALTETNIQCKVLCKVWLVTNIFISLAIPKLAPAVMYKCVGSCVENEKKRSRNRNENCNPKYFKICIHYLNWTPCHSKFVCPKCIDFFTTTCSSLFGRFAHTSLNLDESQSRTQNDSVKRIFKKTETT